VFDVNDDEELTAAATGGMASIRINKRRKQKSPKKQRNLLPRQNLQLSWRMTVARTKLPTKRRKRSGDSSITITNVVAMNKTIKLLKYTSEVCTLQWYKVKVASVCESVNRR